MSFTGVDLHTTSFIVYRPEADCSEVFETCQLAAADLERFCLSLDVDDEIAVEATGHSAWFHDEVVSCVGRRVVVKPEQFGVIRKSVKKRDRNDVQALAFFHLKDMLPETRVETVAQGELALLTHTRDLLVKERTRLINKIHALHTRHGIKLKRENLSSKRQLNALQISRFPALEQVELKALRDQALSPMATIAELDGAIKDAARKLEGYDGLVSIKGIGPRSAAVLLSGIGLNAFYQRIKARCGAGKATIATARKLLAIIYDTLKNGWVFDDFPAFKIAVQNIPAGRPYSFRIAKDTNP